MDLSAAALDVAPLLARLKVLPPASVRHLPVQQELAGSLHLNAHIPGNRGTAVYLSKEARSSWRSCVAWQVKGEPGPFTEIIHYVIPVV